MPVSVAVVAEEAAAVMAASAAGHLRGFGRLGGFVMLFATAAAELVLAAGALLFGLGIGALGVVVALVGGRGSTIGLRCIRKWASKGRVE
jgi:hypothetical protein